MRHPTHLVVLSVQMQASYMGKIRFKTSHHSNYSINCELKYINLTSAFYQVDGIIQQWLQHVWPMDKGMIEARATWVHSCYRNSFILYNIGAQFRHNCKYVDSPTWWRGCEVKVLSEKSTRDNKHFRGEIWQQSSIVNFARRVEQTRYYIWKSWDWFCRLERLPAS